jgi:hypothetical protein
MEKLCSKSCVIPAQAGIRQKETARVADKSRMSSRFAGNFFNHLDSGLRRNDDSVGLSE